MKISLKWLKDYIGIDDLDPKEIARRLTFAGVEVEEILKLASGTSLIIGEIMSLSEHPDSHHLHITNVNLGPVYGEVQIVCGAPNVALGQKVIVARVGAVLPMMTITESIIRGVKSSGMICSLTELGVDTKFLSEVQIKGIEVLPHDAVVGNEDVLGYLGLDDTVLDLKILPNRSDCYSLLNVAKELSALFNRPVKIPEPHEIKTSKTSFRVSSLTEKCPQFALKVIKGIKVKSSPAWLVRKLMAMGVRSINNIVDIGNYIMLLTGQPLHMYDLHKLPAQELEVIDDYEGDFIALDEKKYRLIKGDLVVASKRIPQCLAGVMGAKSCEVDENTTDIGIEAAIFDGKSLRRTSTRLNLISEASARFVKGLNKDQADYVLNMTAELIKELCGYEENHNIASYDKLNHDRTEILASVISLNRRLGTDFTSETILKTLNRIGIECISTRDDEFLAKIPAHRIDIKIEADLSEEIIRLLGFEHIVSVLPELETTVGALSPSQAKRRHIREYLIDKGISETINYTLINQNDRMMFSSFNSGQGFSLLHPLTEDHKHVRAVLIPSLLETLKYNVARKSTDIALFELSEVYTKEKTGNNLAVVLCGSDAYRPQMEKKPYSFYHIKGIFEGIMDVLGIDVTRYRLEPLNKDITELHPGRSVQVMLGKERIGIMGELHPELIKKYDLGKVPTIVMELKLDELLNLRLSQIKMIAPSRYQIVERDLALVAEESISAAEIIRTIKQAGHNKIKLVEIFDVYQGEHIKPGYKSIALRLLYSDDTKTFTSEEIEAIEKEVLEALNTKHHVLLRS